MRLNHLTTCIVIMAQFALVSTAFAEMTSNAEDRFYVISPRSVYDIKNELRMRTPIRERGGSFNGRTNWSINWKYETVGDASGCTIKDVKVHIDVITILPALGQYVRDPQTIEVFNKFSAALTAHERNHGKNGMAAAKEIDAALSSIPVQPDCNTVSRLAEQRSRAIVSRYVQKDRDYDYRTRSGMTEGAWVR